jgi:hypothetical protein
MGLRYNPFNGSFDFTRSPGSYLDGEVATFADLPLSAAAAPLNSAWLVRAGSGLWLLTRKPAGIYIRTATGGTDRNADYTYASAFPDVFSDANFTVYDDADSTKNLQFQLSGITTGTTVTLTAPDASGIIATTTQSADMEITDATKGVILKSPNNSRWRITINDDGTLSRAALALMTLLAFAASGMAQVRDMVTDTNGTVITGRTNPLTFTNPATFSGTLTATGNITMSGTANTAPLQTASSGASLMTRELSDARYSFSRWYTGYELLGLDNTTGALKALSAGNGTGGIFDVQMVAVPDVITKFNLPVDWRVAGQVKIVSYWTDRSATNSGGTNADIAIWSASFARNPTNNSVLPGAVSGTQVKSVFTANYGGVGASRVYVVEQTMDFATVSGISATNPMQIKFVELQRRGPDATDTSTNTIWLSGVHIYVP